MKFIFPVLLFISLIAHSQFDPTWGYVSKKEAEELNASFQHISNDTLKMKAARALGFYYLENNQDSAFYFFNHQLELAKKLKLKLWIADAYGQEGDALRKKGDLQESYKYLEKGIDIAIEPSSSLNHWQPSLFSNARNIQESRLAILAILYHDLGSLYWRVGDKNNAIHYYNKSIDIGHEIKNGKILSLSNGDLVAYYSGDSAFMYARRSIQNAIESGYLKSLGFTFRNLALEFAKSGDIDSAKYYLHRAIQVSREEKSNRHYAWACYSLASLFQQQMEFDSAKNYAVEALTTTTLKTTPEAMIGATRIIADYYLRVGNNDSVNKYQQQAFDLLSTLRNEDIKKLTDYQNFIFNQELTRKEKEKEEQAQQSRLKIYFLSGGLGILLLLGFLLYRNNRQKQKANIKLNKTLVDLKATQSQLIQAEKMASLGELTAGIAHEIQNPLNFVNNFSEVNNEMADEAKAAISKGDYKEAENILNDIKNNSGKINHHGKRADAIVKGMLQHSRTSTGQKESTDINALCDEYVRLAYHGLLAKDKSFNAQIKTNFDNGVGKINVVPQDIGRVVLNLINNAFYALNEKLKQNIEGFEPFVSVSTKKVNDKIEICVKDNGNGIPESIKEKIFQPFFTTKPTGTGTGLGLSLSYDIIKAHGGEIKIESKESQGAEFIILLPNT